MLPSHVRALDAIARCRTPAMGGHLAECASCGCQHLVYHSCRHRACAQCGRDATVKWIARQQKLLLPVTYFHVVFTLPAELRSIVRRHQRALLGALFHASFTSLACMCADPRFLGARIGALAVLHTWTRTLEWHPHVHMLVPGGGLAPDDRTWIRVPARRKRFLVPVRALAKLFRGRFLALARRALPDVELPQIPWGKNWVVFAKAAAQGPEQVIGYLGRYVHRTAITDKAIVACDDSTVAFSYRDSRDGRRKSMNLRAHEFLRRFLQHVPAKGAHRIRSFGLLHPSQRPTLRRLQLLLAPAAPDALPCAPQAQVAASPRTCPDCGEPALSIVLFLSPAAATALARRLEQAAGSPTNQLARSPPPPAAFSPAGAAA
jgi:hypothetical protein